MKIFAVLATGESMSQAVADSVRGRCGVIVVSDAYRLAGWADALVSQDKPWWRHHPEAHAFAGRKFSGPHHETMEGIEKIDASGIVTSGTNSGLLACHVAATVFGATRILLLGIDMGGSHFFGPHPAPLKNTPPGRFDVMKKQFALWPHKGIEVLNCSPISKLECFPRAELQDALCVPG